MQADINHVQEWRKTVSREGKKNLLYARSILMAGGGQDLAKTKCPKLPQPQHAPNTTTGVNKAKRAQNPVGSSPGSYTHLTLPTTAEV